MKYMLSVLFLSLAVAVGVCAQDSVPPKPQAPTSRTDAVVADSELTNAIRRLLRVIDIGNREVASFSKLRKIYSKSFPQIPEKVWDELFAELRAEFTADRITEYYIPIYANHYTLAEINELTRFNATPLGKKFLTVSPQIEQEAQAAGYVRGLAIGKQLREQLRSRGYPVA